MKSIQIDKFGGPEVLVIKDIKLEDPKSGEVLIKNEAIGLNYIDTYHRSGLYPVELPSGIGIEGAGIIEKIGPDVKDFNIGDKVAYASMPIGSYATHRIFPTKKLVKVPNEIELDITTLGLGQNLQIKDLPAIEGVNYVADPESMLVSCVGSAGGRSAADDEEVEGTEAVDSSTEENSDSPESNSE